MMRTYSDKIVDVLENHGLVNEFEKDTMRDYLETSGRDKDVWNVQEEN